MEVKPPPIVFFKNPYTYYILIFLWIHYFLYLYQINRFHGKICKISILETKILLNWFHEKIAGTIPPGLFFQGAI